MLLGLMKFTSSFMVGIESTMSVQLNGKMELATEEFDPTAVVSEPMPPVPPVVLSDGEVGNGELGGEKREIVLGRNVHTTCLAIMEPDEDDESTGDKDAYMASVLARYRKNLTERTKYHLGGGGMESC